MGLGIGTCIRPPGDPPVTRLWTESARPTEDSSEQIRRAASSLVLLLTGAPCVGSPPSPEASRSEERRVGKECRSRWSPYH